MKSKQLETQFRRVRKTKQNKGTESIREIA